MKSSRTGVTDRREKRQEIFLLAPFVILFSIFTIVPILSSFVLSFTNFNMLEMPKFVGLENYIHLFVEDDVFLIAVKNTLIFAIITGPIGYFMALIVAWLINELRPFARSCLTLLFYAPSIAGNVYVIWATIFSNDSYGYANGILMNLGLIDGPIKWLTDPQYVLIIVIIVQLWMSMGVGFLSFVAGLQSIDRSLYEAGAVDGIRNRFQELVYITLPSMGPQLMFGAVMQISSSFGVGVVSSSLAGFPSTDYAAHTVLLHIQDYGTLRFQMGYASAIAVVLFAAMLLANSGLKKILGKYQ